jgi:U3 small nucleolar RNA-associated protein 20
LQFLLDYPLGQKRLEHHLNFLVSNISYTYDAGRVSVLTMMHAVVTKFPEEIIRKFSDLFFLPMVAAMAGAESGTTREATSLVLKVGSYFVKTYISLHCSERGF